MRAAAPKAQRPLAVMVISLIYIVVGIVGLTFHPIDFKGQLLSARRFTWIGAVRLLAIVAGIADFGAFPASSADLQLLFPAGLQAETQGH